AQLLNQAAHVFIGREPMVVVTLHRPIPMRLLKAGRQTPGAVGSIEDAYHSASPHQVVSGAQTADSCANHRDVLFARLFCHGLSVSSCASTGDSAGASDFSWSEYFS